MFHIIYTSDPTRNFNYFTQNPLEYLESISNGDGTNEDTFLIAHDILSIKAEDVMEHCKDLCTLYFDDEVANLSGLESVLPYTVVLAETYSGRVETLDFTRVADILLFCAETAPDIYWTLRDEDGTLRMRTETGKTYTFLMIDGEGETHNIGPIVQKVYGYNY